jgi:hypothetical protein
MKPILREKGLANSSMNVVDVDEAYKSLTAKELKPSSEPRDLHWDNRVFDIGDPDSYRLVIFKRKQQTRQCLASWV